MTQIPWYLDWFVILLLAGAAFILFYPLFSGLRGAEKLKRRRWEKTFRKKRPEFYQDKEGKEDSK